MENSGRLIRVIRLQQPYDKGHPVLPMNEGFHRVPNVMQWNCLLILLRQPGATYFLYSSAISNLVFLQIFLDVGTFQMNIFVDKIMINGHGQFHCLLYAVHVRSLCDNLGLVKSVPPEAHECDMFFCPSRRNCTWGTCSVSPYITLT